MDAENAQAMTAVELLSPAIKLLQDQVAALTKIVDGLEKREQEECKHDYEEGNSVPCWKKVTNGLDVQIPNVPFGMPVLVQTNLSWDVKVCRLCGDFMVKLPKKVQLA